LQKAITDAQAAFHQFPEAIAKQALQSLQTQAASMPASAQSPAAPMGQAGPCLPRRQLCNNGGSAFCDG
jgi:hypothetical protein